TAKASKVLNASMFDMTVIGSSAAYTRAYADAWMEEFMDTKKAMRETGVESTTLAVEAEAKRLEAEMKKYEDEMHDFQKDNNVGFLQQGGNDAATYLAALNRRLAELKTEYDLLGELSLDQSLDRQGAAATP